MNFFRYPTRAASSGGDNMRDADDVPGVSVVLFDNDTSLIEEGFGSRDRRRPEPVTTDILYLVASNTKPLTTLLLAKLVDEGHFEWTHRDEDLHSFEVADPLTSPSAFS
jgi:CubicO group peptidase (beta-lactamase class C family)